MYLEPILDTKEIIPANFRVFVSQNPFSSEDREEFYFEHGKTIQQVIDEIREYEGVNYSVFVESVHVPSDMFARVRPNPSTNVYINVVPGITGAIAFVAAVAGAVGTSVAASAIGTTLLGSTLLATIAANVIGAVIALGVQFLLTSLFAPSSPQRSAPESPTYLLSSARNRANLYGPVPVILGTHKIVPPYGAVPYTETAGGDQYLRIMIAWGYGPISLTNLRIGNTPIEEFDEVELDHDFSGTATDMTLYPQDVFEDSLSIVLDTNFQTIRSGANIDEIGVTVTFPGGLAALNKKGNRTNYSASLEIEYKEIGAGSWTPWIDVTITNNTFQTFQRAYRIAVTNGTYDVRVKRGEEEAGLTNPKVTDKITWTSLQSFKEGEPILLGGVAKSAIRIKATDQLNGVVDQLNAVVSSIIPIWNGSNWSTTAVSNNPAALFRYVLTGAPNKRAVSASALNDTVLAEWYDFCVTENLEFNQYIDFAMSIGRILKDVAAAGKASPDFTDGKWSVIIDKPRSTIVQHFTPRNTSDFASKIVFSEIPHGLRMRFFNKNVEYEEDERIVYDDGFNESNASNLQVLDFPGITDPDQAYTIGRHLLAASRLRPEFFSFRADFENLIATRGDLVRISYDDALIGLGAGRISGISGLDITLSDPVTLEPAKSYSLRVRASDGTSVVKTITTIVSVTNEYSTVSVNNTTSIAVGDLYMFGEAGQTSLEAIIAEITPDDNLSANIVAVPYSPDVYDSYDIIPPYTSLISMPVSVSLRGPAAPVIEQIVSDESVLVVNTTDGAVPTVKITIKPPSLTGTPNGVVTPARYTQTRYKRTMVEEKYVYLSALSIDTRVIIIQDVLQGEAYDFEVRTLDEFGGVSEWTVETNHVVIGATTKPPAVTTLGLSSIGDHTFLTWTYDDIPIDVIAFEIRYHPSQSITDWGSMLPISTEVPRTTRTFTVPSRSGSYAIKAIDVLNNLSENAVYVNASLEDLLPSNLVISYTEAPTFDGTKTNTYVNGSGILQLDTVSVMADWTTLDIATTLAGGAGAIAYETSGTYEFGETDLGIVMTSRVTPSITVVPIDFSSSISDWSVLSDVETMSGDFDPDVLKVEIEIAYSLDDTASPTYTEFQPIIIGDYTARHFKFRATLGILTDDPTTNVLSPGLLTCNMEIDVPDRIEQGYDVSSGTSVKSIAFSPTFYFLKGVSITGQDMQTGDYVEVTNKTRSGFDIAFKNSSGTIVDRTFDYLALGYGQERGT